MPSRRNRRFDRLSHQLAEEILTHGVALRFVLRQSALHLKANSALYWYLHEFEADLVNVLGTVAEKQPDDKYPKLGLLPLPSDYSDRKRAR